MITTDEISKIRQQLVSKQVKQGKITTDAIANIRKQMQPVEPVQQPVTQPVTQPVQTQPVQTVQPVQVTNHAQKAQQGYTQAKDKLHETEVKGTPMTDKINSGASLTPEEVIQLAKEQGKITSEEAQYQNKLAQARKAPTVNNYANKANYENVPVKSTQKEQGKKDAEKVNVTSENAADEYIKARANLQQAKANNDTREIAKNEAIVEKSKQAYNGEKPNIDITSLGKQLNGLEADLDKIQSDYNLTTDIELKNKLADDYNKTLENYNAKRKIYNNAVAYDEIKNNNMANDIAGSTYWGLAGGTHRMGEGAYALGSRLSNANADQINADELLRYNNNEANWTDTVQDIGNTLGKLNLQQLPVNLANRLLGNEKQTANSAYTQLQRVALLNPDNIGIQRLYRDITNHTYKGTAEDLRNELDKIQKELYQNYRDVTGADYVLGKEREQLAHNENVYGELVAIPNAFNTTANMIPSMALAPVGGENVSLAAMAVGAGGGALDEALEAGARYNQAFDYGVLSGATEFGTEKLFGSGIQRAIGINGTIDPSELANKFADSLGIKNRIGRAVLQTMGDVTGESLEEMISETLNPLWKYATYDQNAFNEFNPEQIIKAGIDAIPSTLLMEGMGAVGTNVKINSIQNGIIKSINQSKDLSPIVKNQLINEVREAAKDVKLGLQEEGYIETRANEKLENLTASSNDMKARIPQGYTLPQSTIDILAYTENNRPGLNIAFDTNIQGNGTFVENPDGTRTITLNPNSKRAVEFTLTHELGHDLKGTGEYTQLQNLLTDYAKGKPGYQNALNQLDKTYKESGANYNLQDEATNDMLGQAIGEQEFYNKLAENPTLFNRVTNGLKNLLGNKDTKLKNKIEKLTSNALKQEYRGKQQGTQQSLSEAENDKTLAATHNLTEEKLRGVLELGGFPVPSIAISDVNKLTPTQFGDITVLFDKDTINPVDTRNEVYDRDVWSPTFPQVNYDINNADIKKYITNGLDYDRKDGIIDKAIVDYLYDSNLSDKVNRIGIDGVLNELKKSPRMQYLYKTSVEKGEYTPKFKEQKYNNYHENATLQRFIDIFNKNHDMSLSDFFYHYINYGDMKMTSEQREQVNNEIKEAVRPEIEEYYDTHFKKEEFKKKPELKQMVEKAIQDELDNEVEVYGKFYDFIMNSAQMERNGVGKTIDEEATLQDISKHINQEKYSNWIDNTFGKMLRNATRGIRNNKDAITNNGRRSFKQLHDTYNLENVVKYMTKGQTKGGEGGIFTGGFGSTQAMVANRFNDIDDIRNAKNRLTDSKFAAEQIKPIQEELEQNIQEIANYAKDSGLSNWSFGSSDFDIAAEAIQEFAGKKNLTISNLKKSLNKYGRFENANIPNETLQKVVNTLNELKYIYTDYFEAKPQRAVGFEEIASVLIPSDLAEDTKQQLRDRGIKFTEYDRNVEGDREAKYREAAQDVLFSKQNASWQDFLDKNYNWARGTKTNFEGLPSNEELQQAENTGVNAILKDLKLPTNEELQQAETKSIENEPIVNQVKLNKTNDDTLFSLSDEETKEINDYIGKLSQDTTIDENFKEQVLNKFDNLNTYKQFEDIKKEVQDYKDRTYKGISGLVDIANMKEEDVKQRPMEYKQRVDKNTANQRKFFENAETSPIIAEQTKNRVNATTYEQKANSKTLEEVRQKLDERGNDLVDEWKTKSKNFTDKDVALGAILIERYQQNGDWESAARAVEKLADIGTEAGRAVQMYSIFQRLSPETMAIYQQKALDKAFEDMKKNKTGKWVEANKDKFKLTAEDTQFIHDQVEKASQAIDEETKQRELSKIENRINGKLPPNSGDAIKTLRRIAMLFNPKTQVRNVVGNTLIMPVNDVADLVGTAIDKIISNKTNVRTTSTPNLVTKAKGFGKGVKDAITDYKTGTRTTATGSKYEFEFGAKPFNENTNSKVRNAINHKLNGINDLLSAVMSGGDRPFYEAAYKNSLEGQMKANKVSEPTQEMIDIAVNEALQRTWNDNNKYTETVLKIRKAMNTANINGFGLGDLIIPFAKTPANLTKAMVEYSPAGFIESVLDFNDMRKAISRGEMTPQQQKKFVSSMSKAITGTILYLIAGTLAKSGIITGSADDDKDVRNFEQNVMGIQPYSVRIGDKTYTYSWANPLNFPLAVMADNYKMSKENASLWDRLSNGFKVAGESLVDNSFLSGIKELFGSDSISEGLVKSVESFPESLVPTFLSQIASLGDDKQRQTYEYQNELGTVGNRIKNKIPGARKTLEPQVNAFGEEIENQNTASNAFLNPANVREARTTDTQNALYDLYQETKDKTIFPDVAPSYTNTGDGEKMNLSSKDKVTYSKASGQYITDVYGGLFNSDAFDTFKTTSNNNEGKVKILQKVKEDANLKGREAVGAISEDNSEKLSKLNERLKKLDDAGIPYEDYYIMWYYVNNGEDKKNNTKKNGIGEVIRNLDHDISSKQKDVLYGIFDIGKGSK